MPQRITTVDAFADRPFSGNPAAVCVTEGPAEEAWMRLVAREMNLSETAFLHPEADGYRLRWFTPAAEVRLCGHATLASAHVLWEEGHAAAPTLRFHTLSGLLTAERTAGGIELNFPVEPVEPAAAPAALLEAVGVRPVFAGKTAARFVLELPDAESVRNLKPDLAGIGRVGPGRVVVTARSDRPEYDFVSRYFAPGIGVPEDPVTGAAHCALAAHWAGRLGRTEFRAYQASARGGAMGVRLHGDRVYLSGRAVTVLRGELV